MSLPKLQFDKLTYCGIRDIDTWEAEVIADKKIRVLDVQGTVDFIKNLDAPIHISFDVDALDPELVCSTGTKVPNGLDTADVKAIIGTALMTDKLVSLDVVEFNTALGNPQKSLKAVKEIFGNDPEGLSEEDDLIN